MKKIRKINYSDNLTLWATAMLLTLFGLVMILSASNIKAMNDPEIRDAMYYFKRELMFGGAGLLLCLLIQYLDFNMLYGKLSWFGYGLGVLAILLLLSPLGESSNGATRWLNIGVRFQVAELVKLSVILIMAYWVVKLKKLRESNPIVATFIMWLFGGGAAILLYKISNDLSSSLVVLVIVFGITFIYNNNEKLHVVLALIIVVIVFVYVLDIANDLPTQEEIEDNFRLGRIAAWIAPEEYELDLAYQTLNALRAIGRGGFFGVGLGNSVQKLGAIPEAHTDMIFSVICEELGILGAIMVVYLLVYLLWNAYKVAISSRYLFGSVLATGVLLHIGVQALINISVCCGAIPNTGITLPFISFGGTSLFCNLMEVALLMSISRVADQKFVINFLKIREYMKLAYKKKRRKEAYDRKNGRASKKNPKRRRTGSY